MSTPLPDMSFRIGRGGAAVALLALLAAAVGSAQAPVATQPRTPGSRSVDVAASEERLWIVRAEAARTTFSFREASGLTGTPAPLDAMVAAITPAGRNAYVFLTDGTFYRFAGEWSRASDLPDRARPLQLIGADDVLYGVIRSGAATKLTTTRPATASAATRPFEPGTAPLSIIRHDSRGWAAVAPCPAAVDATAPALLGPRLCFSGNRLKLFWLADAETGRISGADLDPNTGRWTGGPTIGVPHVQAFWVVVVNRTTTLVAIVARPDGGTELVTYCLLDDVGGASERAVWHRVEAALSALPEGVGETRCLHAFGYDQQLGLVLASAKGNTYVRFARFGGPPTISTIDVFAEVRPEAMTPSSFQAIWASLLLVILTILFVFRRRSIVTVIPLPRGTALAFTLQRLGGFIVDFAPLTLLAALLLNVNWSDGLTQVSRWALGARLDSGNMPPAVILWWWGASAGAHVVYTLLMELTARRTLGKMVTRTALLSETTTPPLAWQIVVRNLMRFVELMPPFWILGFFIVLSRSRQRLGDILARTIVVRRVAPPSEDKGTGQD